MKKVWKIKEGASGEFFEKFSEFPAPIIQLLYNRGIKDKESASYFLNPKKENLRDPLLMMNMEKSVERIVSAIKSNEKVAIYGDYDADGISSSAILSIAFNRFGFSNFDVLIPNRYKDGYGLTIEWVKKMAKLGVKLIITLDCGISDFEEIELAKKLGIDVLVFDHHLPPSQIPKTLIVDTHQEGDNYPFKYLAAGGVAFKLVQSLARAIDFPFEESLERQIIDLVALATVADLAPMLDENRILVNLGLEQLKDTQNIGLKALLKELKLENEKKYTARHLGFIIASKLNAVGRMKYRTPEGKLGDVDYSFGLLVTDNEEEASVLAKKIVNIWADRYKISQKMFDEVDNDIESKDKLDDIILYGKSEWPVGFLGPIASRLVEKWNRPVFLYGSGNEEEGIRNGSARTIPNFNLKECIERAGDILVDGGGHKMSAGFKIRDENVEKFREFLRKEGESINDEDLIPSIEIEAVLEPEEITPRFWQIYRKFEPFGKENDEPIFLMKRVSISNIRLVGNGEKHLKMNIEKNGKNFNAIGFNMVEMASSLKKGMMIDIAFTIQSNNWQGREYLDFNLVDVRV